MFVSFCHKLDALCNFHYTPKAPAVEIEVVKNVPAISMEEVLPTAVNDRVMKAPEEIYNKKHGRCVCVCVLDIPPPCAVLSTPSCAEGIYLCVWIAALSFACVYLCNVTV